MGKNKKGKNPFNTIKESMEKMGYKQNKEWIKNLEEQEAKKEIDKRHDIIQTKIPSRYWTAKIRHEEIKTFYLGDKLFLWVWGYTGSGKTESMYALMRNQIYNDGYTVFNLYNESKINYETKFKGVPIIDDLWLSKNPKRKENLLGIYYDLINDRYEAGKKLIITSNFSPDEWIYDALKINDQMVNRITSRFSKAIKLINLGKKDYRRED